MSKGLSEERFKRVRCASDYNFCQVGDLSKEEGGRTRDGKQNGTMCLKQVKMFTSEDSRSQIGSKAEDHIRKNVFLYSNEMRIDNIFPSFGSKECSSKSKPICVPQITWNCPPAFALNVDWHVVAGEDSKERMTQTYRETRVLEALYASVCAIPPSPEVAPELENCVFDDTQALNIPLTPIEEEDSMGTESTPCTKSVECNVPIESELTVNDKFHEIIARLDADIIAAATAAVSTLFKSNEKSIMVDPDLLVKILNEPKLVESLSKVTCPSTLKFPNLNDLMHKPVSEPILSSNDHLSDTLLSPHTIQLPTTSSPNPQPCTVLSSDWATENSNLFPTFLKPYSDTSSIPVSGKPVNNESNLFRNVVPGSSSAIYGSNASSSDFFSSYPKPHSDSSSIPASIKSSDNILDLSRKVLPSSSSAKFGSNTSSSDFFIRPDRMQSSQPLSVSSTRPDDQRPNLECQSSVRTQVIRDVTYYKNLIRLHGTQWNVTQEQCTPPQYQESAPELITLSMVRKPCRFFNSSRGCRSGPTCPFEHVLLPIVRAGDFLNNDRSKRLKSSTGITGQM